ncbi:helix-turn-helix domain-containing protein [Bacillus cereus]|nr:helix-turn-helix transcriptional regulator [Bacillus cereus]
MTLFEKVKELASNQGLSMAELERRLGFSPNTLYKLKTQKPSIDRIETIAQYFHVSTDYLLGRTERKYWELTEKDEKDIQKKLEELIADMSNADALAFSKDSEPMSEETKRLLIISLENSLRLGKEMAKKKFTPKKFRNEE